MNRKTICYRIVAVMALMGLAAGIAAAATVTQSITYQGTLTDAAGSPLTGSYTVTFRVYDASTGGTAFSTDTHSVVATDGLFTTSVAMPFPMEVNGRALWLGIKVGSDAEMTPRTEIRPVPYAFSLRPGAWISSAGASSTLNLLNSGEESALNISTSGISNPGISVSTSGQSSRGAEISTSGQYGTGIFIGTSGPDSTGVSAFTLNQHSNGVDAITVGYNSRGVASATSGERSDGVTSLTYGQSSSGFFASTLGSDSDGVVSFTSGAFSDGVYTVTNGQQSPGLNSITRGENSNGVRVSTSGRSSRGIDAYTQGQYSQGVLASTTGDASAGLDATTSGASSPGVNVLTSNKSSVGVAIYTKGSEGDGISATTLGVSSPGISVTTQGTESDGFSATTWGSSSPGLDINTHGTNSNGLTIYTNGQDSHGIMVHAQDGVGIETWTYSDSIWFPAVSGRNNGAGPGLYAYSAQNTAVYGEAGSASALAGKFRGNVNILSQSTGATVMELGEGLDYSEGFDIAGSETVAPGTVLAISPDDPGALTIASEPYDTRVAGIVAGANGLGSAVKVGGDGFDANVALAGRVYCNVDATYGAVAPGSQLTTSATPGYAMVVQDRDRAPGAILGKAMERLDAGQKGQILVLVTLQ